MSISPRIGVLGVGHLMYHVIPGMMRADPAPQITLSPRNVERSRELGERFGLQVATTNEQLVADSDIVIVAVRPFQVEDLIRDLPWRVDQTVLSFAATIPSSAYTPHVNGASVVLGMPVVSAEFGESPSCLFPDDAACRALFGSCGPVIALAREEDFAAASVFGAYFGWTQALIAQASGWLTDQGIAEDTARTLVAGMTRAGATSVLQRPGTGLEELISELCLPGSITGLGISHLEGAHAFEPWREAADLVFERIKE
jgi:pyrroline-5-carboxylate reductase